MKFSKHIKDIFKERSVKKEPLPEQEDKIKLNSVESKSAAEKEDVSVSIIDSGNDNQSNHIYDQEHIEKQDKSISEVKDDKITRLLRIISRDKDAAIYPKIEVEKGKLSYPVLKEIDEDEHDVSFLEKLASSATNVLEKHVYETLLLCPIHQEDFAINVRVYCSKCSSPNIIQVYLMEHKACGNIIPSNEFINNVNMQCTSCKKNILDMQKEIMVVGTWYQCNNCNNKSDNVNTKLYCRKFNHDFELNQSSLFTVYYYKAKISTTDSYMLSLIPAIKALLVFYGFIAEDFCNIKGKSGVDHAISVYAHDNSNKTILIDIITSETIDDSKVFSTFVKTIDIAPSIAVLIGISSTSERIRTLASSYNILFITGKDVSEILSMLQKSLAERIAVDKAKSVT